jgi:hypothetical protein
MTSPNVGLDAMSNRSHPSKNSSSSPLDSSLSPPHDTTSQDSGTYRSFTCRCAVTCTTCTSKFSALDSSFRDLSSSIEAIQLPDLSSLIEEMLQKSLREHKDVLLKSLPSRSNGAWSDTDLRLAIEVLQELGVQLAEQISQLRGPMPIPRTSGSNTSVKLESAPDVSQAHSMATTSAMQLQDDRRSVSRWPKTEDYPTYDGSIRSDHRLFIEKLDLLKKTYNLPDSELVSKLAVILKDAAGEWFSMRYLEPDATDATWTQWKAFILDRYENDAWKRYMRSRQRMSRYPDASRTASEWITAFVRINRSVDPLMSLDTLKGNILSAIPADLAQLLATRTQTRPSEDPMKLTEFIQIFEEIASFRESDFKRLQQDRLRSNNSTGPYRLNSQRIGTNRYPSRDQPASSVPPGPSTNSAARQSLPATSASGRLRNDSGRIETPSTSANFKCFRCGQIGHTAKLCTRPPGLNALDEATEDAPDEEAHLNEADMQEYLETDNMDDVPEERDDTTYDVYVLAARNEEPQTEDFTNMFGVESSRPRKRRRSGSNEELEVGISDHVWRTSRQTTAIVDWLRQQETQDAFAEDRLDESRTVSPVAQPFFQLSHIDTDVDILAASDLLLLASAKDANIQIPPESSGENDETDKDFESTLPTELPVEVAQPSSSSISSARSLTREAPIVQHNLESDNLNVDGNARLDSIPTHFTVCALQPGQIDRPDDDDDELQGLTEAQAVFEDYRENVRRSDQPAAVRVIINETAYAHANSTLEVGPGVLVAHPGPNDWPNSTAASTIPRERHTAWAGLYTLDREYSVVLPTVYSTPSLPDNPTEADWQAVLAWHGAYMKHRQAAAGFYRPDISYTSANPSAEEVEWGEEAKRRATLMFAHHVRTEATTQSEVWRHFDPLTRTCVWTRQSSENPNLIYRCPHDAFSLLLPEPADVKAAPHPNHHINDFTFFHPRMPQPLTSERVEELNVVAAIDRTLAFIATADASSEVNGAAQQVTPPNSPILSFTGYQLLALDTESASHARRTEHNVSTKDMLQVVKRGPIFDLQLQYKLGPVGSTAFSASSPCLSAIINLHQVKVLMDTGACVSVIEKSFLQEIDPQWQRRIHPCRVRKISAVGNDLNLLGIYPTELLFPHRDGTIRLYIELCVLEMPKDSKPFHTPLIMGSDWITMYGIDLMSSAGRFIKFGRHKHRFLVPVKEHTSHTSISALSLTSEQQEIRDAIKTGPELEDAERAQILAIVDQFHEAFASSQRPLGTYKGAKVKWHVNYPGIDNNPPAIPAKMRKAPYPCSPASKTILMEAIQKLMDLGVVQPSDSPYSAPAVLVQKQGKKPRVVIDYRGINEFVTPDSYPMPRIDHSLSLLSGAKYVTTLDANHGFHQLVMDEDSRQFTAFAIDGGLYEWVRMPQGAKNAPAAFQRAMDNILHKELREGWTRIYIDDIIVFSPTWEDHLIHIQRVCQQCILWGITLSPSKCNFAFRSVAALGRIVSGLQIAVDSNKTSVVARWPPPTKIKQLQSFLGFASYYRDHIENLASMTRPLSALLSSDVAWQWTPERHAAFEKIKQALLSAAVLATPDWTRPFVVHIDASFDGLGATLSQIIDGKERPIVFISRQLRDAELRYGASQLECLALVWALEKLHYYLENNTFEVITDCLAVKSLMNMTTPNRHMLRWQLAIQTHRGNMTIRHKAGKRHTNVDALSRFPLPNDDTNPAADTGEEEYPSLRVLSVVDLDQEFYDRIKRGYEKNDDAKLLRSILSSATPEMEALVPSLSGEFQRALALGKFFLFDELLYHKEGMTTALFVADKETQISILESCHDEISSAHFSFEKTLEKVKIVAWWPKLPATVEAYTTSCETCQKSNKATGKRLGLMQKIASSRKPWEAINLDFMTSLPQAGDRHYNACLVIVDRLSKRIKLLPTHDTASAKDTAWLFWHRCWADVGLPKVMISDRDPKFTSDFWRSLFSMMGSKLALSTAHHPQTDGLAERAIQTVEDMLRRYIAFGLDYEDSSGFRHDWVSLLPALEMAYNSTVQSSSQRTPFELERGYTPNLPRLMPLTATSVVDRRAQAFTEMIDAARTHAQDCVDAAFEAAKKRWDEHHRPANLKPGDQVLISTKHFGLRGHKKLHAPFVGPFTVLKLIGPNAVKLHLAEPFQKRHPVFPVSLLKPYKHAPKEMFGDRRAPPPPPPALVQDGEAEWEIEQILDRAEHKSQVGSVEKYKVRWKGFDSSEDSWLDHSQLENALELVQEYDRAHPRESAERQDGPAEHTGRAVKRTRPMGKVAVTQAVRTANALPKIILGNPLN